LALSWPTTNSSKPRRISLGVGNRGRNGDAAAAEWEYAEEGVHLAAATASARRVREESRRRTAENMRTEAVAAGVTTGRRQLFSVQLFCSMRLSVLPGLFWKFGKSGGGNCVRRKNSRSDEPKTNQCPPTTLAESPETPHNGDDTDVLKVQQL
jgi:hypothetical protein